MRVLIFSGTTEGHELCRFLSKNGVSAEAFVATEYGEAVMEPLAGITVHTGRLDRAQMAQTIGAGALVIDATHPYAAAVTENLQQAAQNSTYLRLLRPSEAGADLDTVPDTAAAVDWLNAHPGRVLLTTGSKELAAYTAVTDYASRLYPRVLPTAEILQSCQALGFPGAHILAMQGPFSEELNLALLHAVGAEILVTKDSGAAGGFAEKCAAARKAGARVLVIGRPRQERGLTLDEMQDELMRRLGLHAAAGDRFPLFVDLRARRCLVFGAGKIAARRIGILRRFGAAVTVIAPVQKSEYAPDCLRGYEKSDLSGAFLAVAATDNRAVNHRIAQDCAAAGIPVSVADCAAESTFFFPAVCVGGGLTAGVVSRGNEHHKTAAAAKRIRTVLEEFDENDTDRQQGQ